MNLRKSRMVKSHAEIVVQGHGNAGSRAAVPCTVHPSCLGFGDFQGRRLNRFPGQPVPTPHDPLSEELLPIISPKPPLAQLETASSRLSACDDTAPRHATSFGVLVASGEASPSLLSRLTAK